MSEEAEAASQETDGTDNATLGSRLRAARESHELSIEKIADELRIEEHVLLALEEDRLSDIRVAPVFVKGYIKQYGRLLALDYDELREAFDRQSDTQDMHLRPNSSIYLRDERQITIWAIAALAVLIVAVALLVWWLGEDDSAVSLSGGSSGDSTSISVAAPVRARAEDAVVAEPQGSPPPTMAAAPVFAVPPVSPAAPAQAEAVTEADAGADAEQVTVQVAEQTGEAAPAPVVPASAPAETFTGEPEPGSVAMLFEFSAESWFELTDARGRRLHYDLAAAGDQFRFMVVPPAQVLIGNADAVTLNVAGEAMAVPSTSLRGNVASFMIDPSQG